MRDNANMLMAYIRSITRTESLADDIFQETMITAWEKIDSFDRTREFGPWLRGIAKNHALNQLRKNKRMSLVCNSRVLDLIDKEFDDLDIDEEASWLNVRAILDSCINTLPELYKHAIKLRYLNELNISEIFEKTNTQKDTIKKRLQRAKALLLDCLKNKGVLTISDENLS